MSKPNNDKTNSEHHDDGGDAGVLSDDPILGGLLLEELGGSEGEGEGSGNEAGDDDGDGSDAGDDDGDGAGGENAGEDEEAGDAGDESEDNGDEEGEGDGESEGDADEGTEDDADGEGDDEDKGEKLPKSVKKLQHRVNKLTRQKSELTDRVATLEQELQQARNAPMTPTADNPLADLDTEEAVDQRLAQMKALKRWCDANPDGGEVEGRDGQKITLDAQQVRERRLAAEEALEDYGPARKQYLKAAKEVETQARKVYPELFQTSSPASKAIHAFIRQLPEIKRLPNYWLILGDAMAGTQARLQAAHEAQKQQQGKKAAPARKPAPPAIRPNAPKQVTAKTGKTSQAQQRFAQTGDKDALADLIAAGL